MIPGPDIDLQVSLPWPVICRLACRALVDGIDLDIICNQAIAEKLAAPKPKK